MDLSTYQFRIFLAVARRLNFTKAAEDLFLTQPAVSTQIHKLERDAGVVLFEQLGRKVCLTPAGQLLYQYCERILALEDELSAALADLSEVCQGPLSIGASTTIGVSVLPALLQSFVAQYPRVTLRLHVSNVPDVARKVLDGELDLGLIAGDYLDERLDSQAFMDDELILVVPSTHPWTMLPAVEPGDLVSEPFLLRERGSTTRALIEQELAAAGVSLNVVAEMNNNEAIIQATRLGLGASIVSRYAVAAELQRGQLRPVPIAGMSLRRCFNLITQKGKHRTPAIRAFQTLLTQVDAEGEPLGIP